MTTGAPDDATAKPTQPRLDPVTAGLQTVLDYVAPQTDGELADYIPQLATADPNPFGIALVSMAGRKYGVGDCDRPFTIQSISKAFVYALAVSDLGLDAVLERVGVEPSGEAFNAIKLEAGTGRPPNPMVNAGALMTTSLVRAQYPEERLERIVACLSAFAGRRLEIDQEVATSELATASRNRALGYLMEGAGSLREPVEEVLSVYCQQCAISVTATDLAVMAATLAAGGVNPVTGDAVVSEDVAVRTQAVMATCGMYDFSGEWLLRVGLPAKSGVAGGLIAVSPAEFGIGVFSPRLDDRGNSVRGIAVARAMADRYDLHLMHHPGEAAPAVYRYELHPGGYQGGATLTIGAQGSFEFAATEQLLAAIDAGLQGHPASDEPDHHHGPVPGAAPGVSATGAPTVAPEAPVTGVVLDLHRVTRVEDISSGLVAQRLGALLADGVAIAIVQREHLKAVLPEADHLTAVANVAEGRAWLAALLDSA
ncbi:MAG: glutaminase A [Solirubrobacteraceae bacterium]|nr:glutaminase A [Solirubrobacteraceae bacterium]